MQTAGMGLGLGWGLGAGAKRKKSNKSAAPTGAIEPGEEAATQPARLNVFQPAAAIRCRGQNANPPAASPYDGRSSRVAGQNWRSSDTGSFFGRGAAVATDSDRPASPLAPRSAPVMFCADEQGERGARPPVERRSLMTVPPCARLGLGIAAVWAPRPRRSAAVKRAHRELARRTRGRHSETATEVDW